MLHEVNERLDFYSYTFTDSEDVASEDMAPDGLAPDDPAPMPSGAG